MTERQIEDKKFETQMYIADKFKDIQMQAGSLKNVEDVAKAQITLTKINDFIDEARRGYNELEALEHEDPDPEEESEEETGMSFFS